jgi:hypothetical protein
VFSHESVKCYRHALGIAYLYFIGTVTAAITKNERFHQFYAIFFLVQTTTVSFLLFQILG